MGQETLNLESPAQFRVPAWSWFKTVHLSPLVSGLAKRLVIKTTRVPEAGQQG